MKPKYQIFVSSTYQDLQEERRCVMEQILSLGHIPVGMELFQASNEDQWNYIESRINICDYFIIIVAERYGSIYADGKSYTQKEFEYALKKGVPAIAFLLDEAVRARRPAVNVEQKRKRKIDLLRKLCTDNRIVQFWSDARGLAAQISSALPGLIEKNPRPGLVSADEWLVENLGLVELGSESSLAACALMNAIRSDLAASGYYRKEQVITFSIRKEGPETLIDLIFSSTIVPLRRTVQVLCPVVTAPAGVKIKNLKYSINDHVIVDTYHPISAVSKDILVVEYSTANKENIKVGDTHSWNTPVLEYAVRFKNSHGHTLKIWKQNGRKGEPLKLCNNEMGNVSEFRSNGAAFAAQGFRWEISEGWAGANGDVHV